jgi:hypothetical protein
MGARASTPALVKAVLIKREPVRRAALAALVETRPPLAWPDPPRNGDGLDTRGWVAALGSAEAGARPAITMQATELADIFSDALSRHRDLVLRALDDLESPPFDFDQADELGLRLLPSLRKLASSSDRAVAGRAVQLLARVSGAEAALAEAAASPRLELRLAALQALSSHPLPSLEAQIDRALGARDWRERRLAALAAGGTLDRVRALAAALDDANGFEREAAAASQRRLSQETDAPVRAAARRALADHHL